ncbi:helix-turn-helix domain-containing protein [Candidatus Erwinia dacicola]|uniref:Putative bacteriophage CI repressor protein n=1 Tax=Candidatus Erwinia dacicola TaxID=252393 RepID=A0A1E7YX49_9GAMM|nr:helix-turn-helix transcriptional regulator [Candidatus Erwinia dacicola]OFC60918.1 hypothetical protein BBW68_13975 [Candidatus Erwinia dacicola]RAP70869.1 putative bacteriophage CI repressor protein [Candidatus Erwinia dacicola]
MTTAKESKFAIRDNEKESIQERLKQLFRGRNLRTVAREWGLPYSTLNNYFTKGANPGLDVVERVCNIENVSIDWLVTGKLATESTTQPAMHQNDDLKSAWNLAFEFMDKREAETLLRILLSGGARGLIKLAEHEASLEEIFMLLPPYLKERAIELIDAHVDAKKGASEGSEVNSTQSPEQEAKRAG